MSAPGPAGRALEGLRVLDLTRLLPGPFASLSWLADSGARVDKIEDLGAGDYLRLAPPLTGDTRRSSSRSTGASAAPAST